MEIKQLFDKNISIKEFKITRVFSVDGDFLRFEVAMHPGAKKKNQVIELLNNLIARSYYPFDNEEYKVKDFKTTWHLDMTLSDN